MNRLITVSITITTYFFDLFVKRSFATLTVARWGPNRDVINVNQDDLSIESKELKARKLMGITYDLRSGRV